MGNEKDLSIMDMMGDIADETIERLKKEERFSGWSDERFAELRALLTADLSDTEEAMEEYARAISELITREDVPVGKKT